MSIYTACKSGIIQRGEELFPIGHMKTLKEYNKIAEKMRFIPKNGERLMTTEEILELYD